MRSPWARRTLIVLLLVGLIFWIAQKTYWDEVPIPQPLQGEAAKNPFYAASRLVESLQARPRWQRVLAAMPPRDAVVVASAWNWGLFAARRERLQRWVVSGGRLVIDRSLIGGQRELEEWTGITRFVLSEEALKRADRDVRYERCPTLTESNDPHSSAPAAHRYKVCGLDRISGLRVSHRISWALRDATSTLQALRVPIGLGSVTLINSTPFGNRALLEGDDAALFVASTQLRRGDAVWFVSEERGASLFSLIWTTGAPVVLLLAALLATWLWRASTRFGPPLAPGEAARRSLAEQIRGTGQFTLRLGGGRALYAAQVRALQETAERRIPGYLRLDDARRVEQLAQLAGIKSHVLAAALNLSVPRRQHDLRHGLAQLESIRRTLSIQPQHRERS